MGRRGEWLGQGWRRMLRAWLLLALLLPCAVFAAATPAVLLLDAAQADYGVKERLAWFGPQTQAGIAAASGGRLAFAPMTASETLHFGPGEALWLHLRVQRPHGAQDVWQLEVPVPVVDTVTLYQEDASGRWFGRRAGDLVPISDWPLAGRYPSFRVDFAGDAPVDLFVEVRHSTALAVPLRLVTAAAHHQRAQLEYLALGVLMGVLALLACASLLRGFLLGDGLYLWYAAYALAAALALAAFTGVAMHLLWGGYTVWADAAPGFLTLLAASLAVLMVSRVSVVLTRVAWLGAALRLMVVAGVVLALFYLVVDRRVGVVLLGAHLVGVAGLSVCAASLTWRRGDPVGLWLLIGAIPLALTVVLSLARVTGWLAPSWLSEYGLVVALTIALPMMFGALESRSLERRSVELRRIASASQDPLTGLMKRGPFAARLQQAVARYQRRGESAAVAVIELTNHDWILRSRGAEAAEEALLRTVIKLRRLVRDVDTTGRLGENRFGLILEGVAQRHAMNAVATRLVAAGLMEEPGRPRDTALRFHVAAAVLSEHTAPATELLEQLSDLLGAMAARTRRPVRFYEPGERGSQDSGHGEELHAPA